MEYYSEEEKAICKTKIELEGKEFLSQRGLHSTKEINELAESFYADLVSSPKSIFSMPKAVLRCKDHPIIAIVFIDILQKNRYEIWLAEDVYKHPWNSGGELIECSKEFDSIESSILAAAKRMESISTDIV